MRSTLSVFVLFFAAVAAHAQPWESWHLPLADGWGELRFGMERSDVIPLIEALGLKPEHGRTGTVRHVGDLGGREANVITSYQSDRYSARGGRLYHIEIYWPEFAVTATKAIDRYREMEQELMARYGPPYYEEDDGVGALRSASGRFLRVFQGPEAQVVLDLSAVSRDRFQLRIVYDSPQLHPDLPGS